MGSRSKTRDSVNTLILIIVFAGFCEGIDRGRAIFYENPKYRGDRTSLSLAPGCFTFSSDWTYRISSVELFGSCIVAWDAPGCKGRSVKLTPESRGLEDLKQIQFDRAINSLNACRGSYTETTKSVSRSEEEIWQFGLREHNKYRRMHGAPDLRNDPDLHRAAQQHANYLARYNIFETSPDDRYGENLATSFEKNKFSALKEVVKRWYDKIEYYNFRDPESNRGNSKASLFASIVWKSTTHAGIGIAWNERGKKWVVVVLYDPAATKNGFFENVGALL